MVSFRKEKVSNEKMILARGRQTRNVILKYVTATLAVFCLSTFYQRTIVVDAVDTSSTFAGDTVRCALALDDDMFSRNLESGFCYEILNRFAEADNCSISVVPAGNADYMDSLRTGAIDIVILPYKDTVMSGISFSREMDGTVWALRSGTLSHIREVNLWISHFMNSDEYRILDSRFRKTSNPYAKAEKGIVSRHISPYDNLIKKYAASLGWDWRLLAAVIYQESRFSINTSSSRGASGLMQVMPSTAEHYEVSDLLDPEQNIKAGTQHLIRLQKMFMDSDISPEEQIKFVLAAYNAGEGRIEDCRRFARFQNLDNTRWEEIVKAIPEMSNEELIQSSGLKFGRFNGKETVRYVDNVLEHYSVFCQICPA